MLRNLLLLLTMFSMVHCSQSQEKASKDQLPSIPDKKKFDAYWYAGKAEITSYALNQARYGENHEGHAVLVFVTEDFSKSKLVKINDPSNAGADRVPVLKLNFTKKFNTGIYPYSMMLSVFTAVDLAKHTQSLKASMSSQEWCGHVYSSYDLKGNTYKVTTHSYFEDEANSEEKISGDLLEDEIWTRIRLNPKSLPQGTKNLIPSSMYVRLLHIENKAYEAQLVYKAISEVDSLSSYQVTYPELDRSLTIYFEKSFPYRIISWKETHYSGWGAQRKKLTTTAQLKKAIQTDYWNKNSNADRGLRKELGLE